MVLLARRLVRVLEELTVRRAAQTGPRVALDDTRERLAAAVLGETRGAVVSHAIPFPREGRRQLRRVVLLLAGQVGRQVVGLTRACKLVGRRRHECDGLRSGGGRGGRRRVGGASARGGRGGGRMDCTAAWGLLCNDVGRHSGPFRVKFGRPHECACVRRRACVARLSAPQIAWR